MSSRFQTALLQMYVAVNAPRVSSFPMIPAFLAILVNDLPIDALVGDLPFEVVITRLLPSDISLSVIKAFRAFDDIGRTRILLSVFRLSWTIVSYLPSMGIYTEDLFISIRFSLKSISSQVRANASPIRMAVYSAQNVIFVNSQ